MNMPLNYLLPMHFRFCTLTVFKPINLRLKMYIKVVIGDYLHK